MQLSAVKNYSTLQSRAKYFKENFDLENSIRSEGHQRIATLCVAAPHVLVDTVKQSWGDDILKALVETTEEMDLPARRATLLSGQISNPTEHLPALHAHWRMQVVKGNCSLRTSLNDMLTVAERIRASEKIDDIVHIGIGGSSLGPELALQALKPFHSARQRVHIISNLDGHDLHQTLQTLNPHRTLLIVVSKSWSTVDTLRNAESAISWMRSGGVQNIAPHVVAVSSKPELAESIGAGTILGIPDGIGGRYSLWCAVGLPLAVAIGAPGFLDLLKGGAEMDEHFAYAPASRNAPMLLGLLDVWNSTFLQMTGRCVVPYHYGLRRLPAYLQQLEMESNGKRVDLEGQSLYYETAGVTWGEEGSNSQHSFFQWLHHGTRAMPVEFLLIKHPEHPLKGHHLSLLANGLAQTKALMQGQSAGPGQLAGHQDFPGNRPSTIIGLERLNPITLGSLLAMYEHRTFVAGVMWGINPFDQFGVELGKNLASRIEARLVSGETSDMDASTAYWINWLRN